MIHKTFQIRNLILAAAFCAVVLAAPALRAATFTWDPSGNRSDAAGSGPWDTTSPIWDNGTADVTWVNNPANSAILNGADGTYTMTVGNGIMVGALTVNASGYTLQGASAASPGTLSSGLPPARLFVATGKTLTIGANMTVNLPNSASINYGSAAYAGTINVLNGGVLAANDNPAYGGIVNIGANGRVGNMGATPVLNAGNLTVNGTNASFAARSLNATNSTITINQGTVDTGGGFSTSLTNTTVNLNGGSFIAGYFTGSDANSTFNLNGGVFQNTVYGGMTPTGHAMKMFVQGGGAKFTLFTGMTLPVALQHDPSGPAIDGGLTVNAGGALTLSQASTYTGGTLISGSSLMILANGGLGSGAATVASTAVSLSLGTGVTTPFSDPSAQLTLAGGGTANTADVGYLNLTNGNNITVGSLVLGGTLYTSGVFTSANFPNYISGTGSVTVVPEPGSLALVSALAGGLAFGVYARRTRPPRRV